MKSFVAQIKSQMNRIMGKSYDDNTTEAEVLDDLQATDPIGEATEANTGEIAQLQSSFDELKAENDQLKADVAELKEASTGSGEEESDTVTAEQLAEVTTKLEGIESSIQKNADSIKAVADTIATGKAGGSARAGAAGDKPKLSKTQKAFTSKSEEISNESQY